MLKVQTMSIERMQEQAAIKLAIAHADLRTIEMIEQAIKTRKRDLVSENAN